MKSSLVWYSIPRIMANFLWYYICFPFSLSWSSIFLCNIPQPGVRCPMRLVSVRYYLLAFNIKFFILNIFKYLIVFIYSPTFLHLRIFQPYQVSEPGCVCQILFHSFQYSIFYIQYFIILYSSYFLQCVWTGLSLSDILVDVDRGRNMICFQSWALFFSISDIFLNFHQNSYVVYWVCPPPV